MKKGQKLWTRDELILAINLYCKLPFGRLHRSNPEVVKLAGLIGRTTGSVAYKLVNFASLDPSLKSRGIKGAANASKLDKEIWNEFYNNWDDLPYQSEKLRAEFEGTSLEERYHLVEGEMPAEGKTRDQLIKVRVNQQFFRSTILASYNNKCCITGLENPQLLVAGHIKPWGVDQANRLNPRNGIAINGLHDKAFETGLMTITTDYKIKISLILKNDASPTVKEYFLAYDGNKIHLPSRFLPDIDFLNYHNHEKFQE